MLSVYFICKHKGWVKKAGFVICIILFIFYIAFSDSRNGLVSLLVGITTWIFVWISQKKKDTEVSYQWLYCGVGRKHLFGRTDFH